MLHRVLELKEETAIFLSDSNNSDGADLFTMNILFRNCPIW
jgi:hypothetical protein